MGQGPRIAVVVPTYNEAHNLPELVRHLLGLGLPGLSVIVVDDNSPDGTGQVAGELARQNLGRVTVVHRPAKMGLGSAYVRGFQHALQAGAEVVVQMDADLSHDPAYIPRFLEMLEGADVVVGSRYVPGGGADPRWPLARRLLSRLGNLYARWASGLRVRDTTSGFKAFRRGVLEALDWDALRCRGFAFQAEVAYHCQRLGFRVVECPIRFAERARGRSKLSFAIVWEALWRLPLLRWTSPRRAPSARAGEEG